MNSLKRPNTHKMKDLVVFNGLHITVNFYMPTHFLKDSLKTFFFIVVRVQLDYILCGEGLILILYPVPFVFLIMNMDNMYVMYVYIERGKTD